MKSNVKILNAVGSIGLFVLSMGIILFLVGLFVNDFKFLISIGIGTVVGAVFIFLMGVFFVATEEMLEKTNKGTKTVPIKAKKGVPL